MTDKLKLEGVDKKGYGKIPKLVMKDEQLTIEAKAIYAYFASYAGGGETAFPSIELICHDLGISENRLFKHRKLLVERGYLSIEREQQEKGWSKNIYTLHQSIHLQNVGIRNEGIENEGIENEGTNNNSTNNNSIKSNSINKNKRPSPKIKTVRHKYGEYNNVLLTDEQLSKLKDEYTDYGNKIEKLSEYMESTGKTYKNHYATIKAWARKDNGKTKVAKEQTSVDEIWSEL